MEAQATSSPLSAWVPTYLPTSEYHPTNQLPTTYQLPTNQLTFILTTNLFTLRMAITARHRLVCIDEPHPKVYMPMLVWPASGQ